MNNAPKPNIGGPKVSGGFINFDSSVGYTSPSVADSRDFRNFIPDQDWFEVLKIEAGDTR